MEKIEKLEEFNWVSGRDAITIALCNTIIRKQNEIIDHLNSQVQPEEIDNTKLVMPPSAYDQAEKEGFNMKNKVKSKLLPQDTPEEWVEKLWKLIDAYRDSKDINSELERIEEVNQYVKQLLEERETKAFNEGVKEMEDSEQIQADWDIEELGNIVDKIVKKLSKLTTK